MAAFGRPFLVPEMEQGCSKLLSVPVHLTLASSMRIPIVIALGLVLNIGYQAQRQTVKKLVPSAAADKFTTVELKNPDVVVRRYRIPGGETADVSPSVHDYVIVSFGRNSVVFSGYQTNFEMNLADGEVQVLQGGWPHSIKNGAQTASDFLTVEVTQNIAPKSAVCGLGAKNCYQTRFGKSAQGEYQQTLLFETDSAALFRAQLGAGVPMHQHGDQRRHLIIALTPLQANIDGRPFSLKPGETYWYPGAFQEIANDGAAATTFLVLELK